MPPKPPKPPPLAPGDAEARAAQTDHLLTLLAHPPAEPTRSCRACGMLKPPAAYRENRTTCRACESRQSRRRRAAGDSARRVSAIAARVDEMPAEFEPLAAADNRRRLLAASVEREHETGLTASARHAAHAERLVAELDEMAQDGIVIGPDLAIKAARNAQHFRNHVEIHAEAANSHRAAYPTQTCRACRETLPADAFGFDRRRSPTRLATICRACDAARHAPKRTAAAPQASPTRRPPPPPAGPE